jgi:hypothetical protein
MSRNDREHLARLDTAKADLCHQFGWKPLDEERVADGYGRRLWLKIRSDQKATSWDWSDKRLEPDYDMLVGIVVSPTYELLMVVRATRDAVRDVMHHNRESYRFRWNDRTRRHPGVEIIFPLDGSDPTRLQ